MKWLVLLLLLAAPVWADGHIFTTAAGTDLVNCESDSTFGNSYPPPFQDCYDSSPFFVSKDRTGGHYYIENGLMRWDTSLLNGATITSATLDLCFNTGSTSNVDGRNLNCEWYPSNWGPSSADYTTGSSGTALSVSLGSINQATFPCQVNTFTLTAPDANIVKDGTTALRCTIDGGQPTGSNEVNFVGGEDLGMAPKLSVVFSTGPTFTPTQTVTGTPPTFTPTRTPTPTPTCGGFTIVNQVDKSFCFGDGDFLGMPIFTNCMSEGEAQAWDHVKCPPSLGQCKVECDAAHDPITGQQWGHGLIRFHVSPFPIGTTIQSATMEFIISAGTQEDNLNAWGEWYHDFTFPGTIADYSTTPSSSAFDLGPILTIGTPSNLVCPTNPCLVPVNDFSQIPLDGGVTVLRNYISSRSFTGCNSWNVFGGSDIRISYVFPCGAETPTPGTPTSTPTIPPVTATFVSQATATTAPTNTATLTQTAAPTGTGPQSSPTRTPTATSTPTPNPLFGCCACPDMCSSAFTQSACQPPCTFGGPGTVCVEVFQ